VRPLPFVFVCAAVALPAQEVAEWRACALRERADVDARCDALSRLQRRGALDGATVRSVLASENEVVGRCAAAIVRHEWVELPTELLRGLADDPVAARRFLRELAIAPRPAAVPWVEAYLEPAPGRSADDRCLALAARGELRVDDGRQMLDVLAEGQAGDGFREAVAVMPSRIADGLVGRLHALLLEGKVGVEQAAPVFDRLSHDGVQHLLGLVATLPSPLAEGVYDQVAMRDVRLVRERARAALDGEIPLEAMWLRNAGPLLTEPARRERLFDVLRDQKADYALQRRAFDALIDGKCAAEPVLTWAVEHDDEREALLMRVLETVPEQVPERLLVEWLTGDPRLSHATVRAISRLPAIGPRVEGALLASLDGAALEGKFHGPVMRTLMRCGSAEVLRANWPRFRTEATREQLIEWLDVLGRRGDAVVRDLLSAELSGAPPEGWPAPAQQSYFDEVRLALVRAGDRSHVAALVADAPRCDASFVRRCAAQVGALDSRQARSLLEDAAADGVDEELAAELAAWAGACRERVVADRLRAIWEDADCAELVREVAARALLAGPTRGDLIAALRAALAAGPLPDHLQPLSFEVFGALQAPRTRGDARLVAELVLMPALGDPQRELELVGRWPDGRFGFPLVAAAAQCLRGGDGDAVREGFAAAAAAIRADERWRSLSRQRVLVLWRSLEADRAMQRAAGEATAELLLALPGEGELGEGPAHWFALLASERRGDFAAAAGHARSAVPRLLHRPADRQSARLFLGERDPGAGFDPWAALAASRYLCAFRRAQAAGDGDEAAAAAHLVREFAGRDIDTIAAVSDDDAPPATRTEPPR
jgi:hypothetical protein